LFLLKKINKYNKKETKLNCTFYNKTMELLINNSTKIKFNSIALVI
jgi:hypothetical protein